MLYLPTGCSSKISTVERPSNLSVRAASYTIRVDLIDEVLFEGGRGDGQSLRRPNIQERFP